MHNEVLQNVKQCIAQCQGVNPAPARDWCILVNNGDLCRFQVKLRRPWQRRPRPNASQTSMLGGRQSDRQA